jgi:hypothetical protein
MPAPRHGHAAVLGADGRMYVIGGVESYKGPPLKTVLVYTPKTDSWMEGPDMNVRRVIYAIGGTDRGAFEKKELLNRFLPKSFQSYDGKVQDTVEVLDINIKRRK